LNNWIAISQTLSSSFLVISEIELVFFLIVSSAVALFIGFFIRFFKLEKLGPFASISLLKLIAGFAIYFLTSLILSFVLYPFLKYFNPQVIPGVFYLFSNFFVILLFLLYFSWLGKNEMGLILGKKEKLSSFFFGILSWLIAFPLSSLVGMFVQIFINMLSDYNYHEQVAVSHLKNLLNFPFLLFLTVLSFSIVVPFLEEFIFRGLLQNFFKRFFNRHVSIIFSAVIFALFHFSSEQSYDNIELIISLSVLGWFLGFIYEKKQSLMAPFGLHFAFNTISILRIIFF